MTLNIINFLLNKNDLSIISKIVAICKFSEKVLFHVLNRFDDDNN